MCAKYSLPPFDWLKLSHGHTTWSQGNLHYMRLHFLKLDREFFCLQPSLARLYSSVPSPSERLRSDGSLAINSCGHTTDFYLGKTDLPRAN